MEKEDTIYQVYRELRWIGVVLISAALITLGAILRIPFYPVPFTLQTLAIFIIGFTQPPKQAVCSVICYLIWACIGLPVLGGPANPLWIIGKSGGYLVAFPIAAYCIAKLRSQPLLALVIAHSLIWGLGWIWLACFFGPKVAFLQGIWLFVPSAALKALVAYLYARWRRR